MQDTYLLASQQSNYLPLEAAALRNNTPFHRREAFRYTSQNDATLARLSRFLDRHLPNQPNRAATLTTICPPSDSFPPAPLPTPSREFVLDRWAQHTAITPSSLSFVRTAWVAFFACALGALVNFALFCWKCLFPVVKCLLNARLNPMGASESLWDVFASSFVTDVVLLGITVAFAAAALAAMRSARAFSFQKTRAWARKDLERIPECYPDGNHQA